MSDHDHKPIFSDPLFCTVFSFFTIIFLYFPQLLWRILLSPVIILAGILLLSLLRLGATQRSVHIKTENQSQTLSEIDCKESISVSVHTETENQSQTVSEIDCKESAKNDAVAQSEAVIEGSSACFEESFVQWNVRAPLEVIYEDLYEGEDLDKETSNESDPEPRMDRVGLDRYPSLSLYYPETDSDTSSEGGWPESMDENVCFMWDEDEDRDELIEISLEKTNKKPLEFRLELEDNLIEIDLTPMSFPAYNSW